MGAIVPFGADMSFIIVSSDVFMPVDGPVGMVEFMPIVLFIVEPRGVRVVCAIAAVEIAMRATQPMVLSFMGLLPGCAAISFAAEWGQG